MYYVLDVRPDMTVWPLETWTDLPGQRASPQTQTAGEERQTAERSRVAGGGMAGDHDSPCLRFSAQRVRVTRRRKPGEVLWAVYRQNLDGSEPRYYLSLWRPWPTWAAPAGGNRVRD